MTDYVIAIPSYRRSKICASKTLAMLQANNIPRISIDIFIVENELNEYQTDCNPQHYNTIVIGEKGIVPQREFISNYYPEGTNIIGLDDDIESIDLSLTNFKSLEEFFVHAFKTCVEEQAFIWSAYPVYNPFFRKDRKPFSTELAYMVTAFYGFINRRNDSDLQLKLTRECGNKEDVERSILYWLKDGKTIRFNQVGFKTKYYGTDGGGLGKLQDRIEPMKQGSIAIHDAYPELTKIKVRKNGLYEIVLKSSSKWKNNKLDGDDEPKYLASIDASELAVLYDMLNQITVPMVSKSRVLFGNHRAFTLGYIRARNTKIYGLSRNSKKYPKLYQEVLRIGKMICPFEFSAIRINHNVTCPRHLDGNNSGNSVIVSFGDYDGCDLVLENYGTYDTNCKPLMFNGSNTYHWNTELISGNKYSMVFFTNYK